MLIKGLALTALVATTPLALTVTQSPSTTPTGLQQPNAEAELRSARAELAKARRELAAARSELEHLHGQIDHALDRLEATFEPQRDRNCSPTRSRALMSHYQWLKQEGHSARATDALAKVVDQAGNNPDQLNNAAWELMTEKESAGKFDEVALAIAQRMEQQPRGLRHNQLDTAALAHFLNGDLARAVELEKEAITRQDSEDYRRRLRTYEAAQTAVAKASATATPAAPTLIAAGVDD